LPDDRFGAAQVVGGFWTRDHRVEVDLVGTDRMAPPVEHVAFIGSIKWRQRKLATGTDVAELIRSGSQIGGVTADTPLVLVSRSGIGDVKARLAARLGPDELLASFQLD
jgi:hypothetical protein